MRRQITTLIQEHDSVALVEALGRPDVKRSARKRGAIVRALGELGDSAAVPKLCEVLVHDSKASVRRYAAIALGRLNDPAALPALRSALDDADEPTAEWAPWGLGRLKDRQSVGRLRECLRSPRPGMRSGAAWALGEIGDQAATLDLIELLGDRRRTVRGHAGNALAKLGDSRALEPMREVERTTPPFRTSGVRGALRDLESRFG